METIKRDNSIDTLRGFGVFLVMLGHAGGHLSIFSPIELPVFFFVSGLLLKIEKMELKYFLREKIGKLLLSWVIISYVQAYLNVSTIKMMVQNPTEIIYIGLVRSKEILIGHSLWFIPALLITYLWVYLIDHLTGHQVKLILLFSIMLSIGAWLFMRQLEVFRIWNICSAFINQVFVSAGYCIRISGKRKEIKDILSSKLWILTYLGVALLCSPFYPYSKLDTRCNQYNNFFLYLLLASLGICGSYAAAAAIKKIPLITFMGGAQPFLFCLRSSRLRDWKEAIGGYIILPSHY